MKSEYILCAAIWVKDGKEHVDQPENVKTGFVICGHRHCNCIELLARIGGQFENKIESGFLTKLNRFVDRVLASEIAFYAGQTEEKSGYLISEELY